MTSSLRSGQATVEIPDMTCGGCASQVRSVLEGLLGISNVRIDLETKLAKVDFNPDQVTIGEILAAIASKEFQAQVVSPAE